MLAGKFGNNSHNSEMKSESFSQSASRIVGLRAVFQHRVVGVAMGFLCGSVMPRTQTEILSEVDRLMAIVR